MTLLVRCTNKDGGWVWLDPSDGFNFKTEADICTWIEINAPELENHLAAVVPDGGLGWISTSDKIKLGVKCDELPTSRS